MMTEEEYGEAYIRYFKSTVKALMRQGLLGETAKDAASSAWVRGFEKRDQLRNPKNIRVWINRIAINLYVSSMRSRYSLEGCTSLGDTNIPETESARTIPCIIDVNTFLSLCTVRERSLLNLYIEGHNSVEIAVRLHSTGAAVRLAFMRLCKKIRKRIEERELTPRQNYVLQTDQPRP